MGLQTLQMIVLWAYFLQSLPVLLIVRCGQSEVSMSFSICTYLGLVAQTYAMDVLSNVPLCARKGVVIGYEALRSS